MATVTIPDTQDTLSLPKIKQAGRKKLRKIFAVNPFVNNHSLVIHTKKRGDTVAKGMAIVNKENEKIADAGIVKYQEVETTKFLKLYTENVASWFELTKTAQRVFVAVVRAIQLQSWNSALIFLPHTKAKEYWEELGQKVASKSTYYAGLSELIEAQFIAPAAEGENWYWTNPNIVFNGSRIAMVNVIKDKSRSCDDTDNISLDDQTAFKKGLEQQAVAQYQKTMIGKEKNPYME